MFTPFNLYKHTNINDGTYHWLHLLNPHDAIDADMHITFTSCKYYAFLSNTVQHTLLRLLLNYFVCYSVHFIYETSENMLNLSIKDSQNSV